MTDAQAGAAPGADPNASAPPPAPGAGETGAAAPAWSPPEGFPPEFIGADPAESLGKLFEGYQKTSQMAQGLRQKLGQQGPAPKGPEDYVFEPSEKVKPFMGDLSGDPVFKAAQKAFFDAEVPPAAFQKAVGGLYEALAESGALVTPHDPSKEIANFQQAFGLDKQGVETQLKAAEAFAKGLPAQLQVPDALRPGVEAALAQLTDTAEGNALLAALQARLADNGIRVAGEGAQSGLLTEQDLQKLDADPRIDPRNRDHADPQKRFDPELRRRYNEAYNRLYPRTAAAKEAENNS